MEKLGDILRNTRLNQHLSIEQVAKDTNIRRPYLEAMENEQWDFFGKHVYLKCFLRTYCRYLGIDKSEYVIYLIENIKIKPNPTKIPEEIDLTNAPRRNTAIFLGLLAIILLIATSYIYQQFIIPFPDQNADIALSDENPDFTLPPSEQNEPDQNEPVQNEFDPNEPEQITEIREINLTLKCLDDRCWVEIKNSANKIIYQRIIEKGEEINFTDPQRITFQLGNAGQVQVWINEQNFGVMGEIGAVITKTYVLENNEINEL